MNFLSQRHKELFINALKQTRKISNTTGEIDTEYGTAFFLLTSSTDIWDKCKGHVSGGIDFTAILRSGKFSSGEKLIIRLAQDLFGAPTCKGISVYDMVCTLDNENFNLCIKAMMLRKRGHLSLALLESE